MDFLDDQSNLSPLHASINSFYYCFDFVNLLLDNGASINLTNKNGQTALHLACKDRNFLCTRLLLERGADPTILDVNGQTPLSVAVDESYGGQSNYGDIVGLVLRYSLSYVINLKDDEKLQEYHRNYYFLCESILNNDVLSVFGFLSQKTLMVDFLFVKGESPLHFAVLRNYPDIVKILIDRGADVNSNNYFHRRPLLHLAIKLRHFDLTKLLLNHNANPNTPSSFYYGGATFEATPLYLAAFTDQPEVMRLLLSSGAYVNIASHKDRTPLHVATELGHWDCIDVLLENGADLDSRDSRGETALFKAVARGRLKILELLLKRGADPNAKGSAALPPIHQACWTGSLEIVKMLLKYGAKPEVPGYDGKSLLHYAAKGRLEVLDFLLSNGIGDVNGRDVFGKVPAKETEECEKLLLLLQHGNQTLILPAKCYAADHECPIITHIVKMKLLKYEVDVVLSYNLGKIMNEEYEEELGRLRDILVNYLPRTSLYDIIFMRRNPAARYARNEVCEEIIKSGDLGSVFCYPHYGFALELKFQKAERRRDLMDRAQEVLSDMTGMHIPEICSEKILKYFNEEQLKKLMV